MPGTGASVNPLHAGHCPLPSEPRRDSPGGRAGERSGAVRVCRVGASGAGECGRAAAGPGAALPGRGGAGRDQTPPGSGSGPPPAPARGSRPAQAALIFRRADKGSGSGAKARRHGPLRAPTALSSLPARYGETRTEQRASRERTPALFAHTQSAAMGSCARDSALAFSCSGAFPRRWRPHRLAGAQGRHKGATPGSPAGRTENRPFLCGLCPCRPGLHDAACCGSLHFSLL